MGRGNYGDAARWVRDRKSFHDSVDEMIRQSYERRAKQMFEIQCLLEDLFLGSVGQLDKQRCVFLTERVGADMVRVYVTRTGNTKGHDKILLKIVEEK